MPDHRSLLGLCPGQLLLVIAAVGLEPTTYRSYMLDRPAHDAAAEDIEDDGAIDLALSW